MSLPSTQGLCSEVSLHLLRRNANQFRGGIVFKTHRLVYRSTLGSGAIKKKKSIPAPAAIDWQSLASASAPPPLLSAAPLHIQGYLTHKKHPPPRTIQ